MGKFPYSTGGEVWLRALSYSPVLMAVCPVFCCTESLFIGNWSLDLLTWMPPLAWQNLSGGSEWIFHNVRIYSIPFQFKNLIV